MALYRICGEVEPLPDGTFQAVVVALPEGAATAGSVRECRTAPTYSLAVRDKRKLVLELVRSLAAAGHEIVGHAGLSESDPRDR